MNPNPYINEDLQALAETATEIHARDAHLQLSRAYLEKASTGDRDSPAHELAADLRRAFSGIVAGHVKESGLRLIDEHGPFELHGDRELLEPLDALLASFVRQRRMRIGGDYQPCYRVVT